MLKEKRADGNDSSSEEESDDESLEGSEETKGTKSQKKSDVLDKLMGGKKADAEKPSIQEMAE